MHVGQGFLIKKAKIYLIIMYPRYVGKWIRIWSVAHGMIIDSKKIVNSHCRFLDLLISPIWASIRCFLFKSSKIKITVIIISNYKFVSIQILLNVSQFDVGTNYRFLKSKFITYNAILFYYVFCVILLRYSHNPLGVVSDHQTDKWVHCHNIIHFDQIFEQVVIWFKSRINSSKIVWLLIL